MPYLIDLATACRNSGLKVVEVDGWRTRGHGPLNAVQTIVCHHTATSRHASGNYPSLGVVRDGRPGLDGPLAQLGLGRDGTVYVIAAGVAWHAGETAQRHQDNWHAIGIEAEHDGISPWPDALVDAYARLCAALREHYNVPLACIEGHKEIAVPRGRKIDPNFDMSAFRRRVARIEEDDMPAYRDWSEEDRKALANDVADAIWEHLVDRKEGVTAAQALRRSADHADRQYQAMKRDRRGEGGDASPRS